MSRCLSEENNSKSYKQILMDFSNNQETRLHFGDVTDSRGTLMPDVPNVRTKELPGRGLCSLSGFSSLHMLFI